MFTIKFFGIFVISDKQDSGVTHRSERSKTDAGCSDDMGIATTRTEDRCMAITGKQDYAEEYFEHHEGVLNAGVLLALPALISRGLEKFFKVFHPFPPWLYGLHHMIIILCGIVPDKESRTIKEISTWRTGETFRT